MRTLQAQRGEYYPSVSAGFSGNAASSQAGTLAPRAQQTIPFEIQPLHAAGDPVSFVPDVFGLNRRTVEFADAQERGTRYR